MSRRKLFKGFSCPGMLLERRPQIGRNGEAAGGSVELKFNAHHVSGIGASRLAQRGVECKAIASGPRRNDGGAGTAATHDCDHRNVTQLDSLAPLAGVIAVGLRERGGNFPGYV